MKLRTRKTPIVASSITSIQHQQLVTLKLNEYTFNENIEWMLRRNTGVLICKFSYP